MFVRLGGLLFVFMVPIALGAIIPKKSDLPATDAALPGTDAQALILEQENHLNLAHENLLHDHIEIPDINLGHEAMHHTHAEIVHLAEISNAETLEEAIALEAYEEGHQSSQDSGMMESFSSSDQVSDNWETGYMYETLEDDPNYATSDGLENAVEDIGDYETFETLGFDDVELVGYDRLDANLETSHTNEPAFEVETVVLDQDQYTPNEVLIKPGAKDCYPVERTVYQEEMVPYTQQTCITRQQTDCQDVVADNCEAVVEEVEDRNCFNVTENICQMEESVEYAPMSPELEQMCKDVEDSVCDTIYELKRNPKTDYACIQLENQKCWQENPYVSDRTCVSSFEFSCTGSKAGTCLKTPTKKCYNTPRRIEVDVCKPELNQRCEKLKNFEQTPLPRQHCHPATKKVCKLVPRMQPKDANKDKKRKAREMKFIYKEKCEPRQRQVCGSSSQQKLVPSCTPETRRVCTHVPAEDCTSEEKEYKFKREKLVVEIVCKDKKVEVVDQSVNFI